ncbi:MFS family permease [Paenibacillus turicensis]|uniref:MFS family permease n=1 Tax=Paenibacillus turicensis TaxID=160487 RepID=A0ABS4FS01_9BACL|nr:MFS transporter [Paenibacillus turicensis]MBP1905362.1 MFS family permease [Paenibacillus turicensis]
MKRIAILSVSLLLLLAGAALSPALFSIMHSYPAISPVLIKSLVTIPSICVIIVNLLLNTKNKFTSQKQQLLVGLIIYALGGMLPLVSTSSFTVLLSSRVILGLGLGLIATPAIGVINEFFEGEQKQTMLGLAGAMNNLGTVIAVLFAGFVSIYDWHYTFYIYSLAVLSFVLILCYLPNHTVKKSEKKKLGSATSKATTTSIVSTATTTATAATIANTGKPYLKLPLLIYAQMLLATVIYFIIPTNLSIYISEKYGYTHSSISGILMAVVSLAGVLTGLLYRKINQHLESIMGEFIFILFVISMGLMSISSTLLLYVVGLVISGLALGLALPYFNSQLIAKSPREKQNQALALGTSMIFIGQFISPFLIDGLLPIVPGHNPFMLGAMLAVVIFIVVRVQHHKVINAWTS